MLSLFRVPSVLVDVIGVVKEAGPLAEITTKMAKQVSKYTLVLRMILTLLFRSSFLDP